MEHLFYRGDNLEGLSRIAGMGIKVDLVYIDPPFATNNEFLIDSDRANTISASGELAYADTVRGDEYLQQLGLRLEAIRRVLADDGSIYVHIDVKMEHHVRLLMDDVFGPRNFRNSITRIKCNPKNFNRYSFGNIKDTILFYSVSPYSINWHPQEEPLTGEDAVSRYPLVDDEGPSICDHAAARSRNHAQRAYRRYLAGDAAAGGPPLALPTGAAGRAGCAGAHSVEQHRQSPQDHLRRTVTGEAAAGRVGVQGPAASQLPDAEKRRNAGAHHSHLIRALATRFWTATRAAAARCWRLRGWAGGSSGWTTLRQPGRWPRGGLALRESGGRRLGNRLSPASGNRFYYF